MAGPLGSIFGAQKAPAMPAPPPPPAPPPSIDDASERQSRADAARRRRGRAATVLTSPAGVGEQAAATKTLLGA
jgi:hypothetical protein